MRATGLVGFNGGIGGGIDDDSRRGGARGEADGLGGAGGADAAVVAAQGRRPSNGVVEAQSRAGAAGTGEGIDEVGGAIFRDGGCGCGEGDGGEGCDSSLVMVPVTAIVVPMV